MKHSFACFCVSLVMALGAAAAFAGGDYEAELAYAEKFHNDQFERFISNPRDPEAAGAVWLLKAALIDQATIDIKRLEQVRRVLAIFDRYRDEPNAVSAAEKDELIQTWYWPT